MADSNPAKRRKISPSTEVPINAPSSPSKIPIPTRIPPQPSQDGSRSGSMPRRPSFASPTKASLARQNVQIATRTEASGRHEVGNTETNIDTTTVKASIEHVIGDRGTVGGNIEVPQTPDQGTEAPGGQGNNQAQNPLQNQGVRSVTGFLASAPRRRSRTPGKPSESSGAVNSHAEQLQEELLAGPIRRPALRRSPPAGSQSRSDSQPHSQPQRFSPTENPDTGTAANIGIVRKPALRRSPPTASQRTSQSQPPSQRSAEKLDSGPAPVRKSALRRSPPQIPDQTPPQPENIQDQVELQPQIQSKPQLPVQSEPEVQATRAHHTPTHARHSQPADISGQDRTRNDEPELPPTPVQRGLEDPIVTTPPTGIHDTPSKRRSKMQDQAMGKGAGSQASPSKPSPLKHQSQAQSFSASLAPRPLPKFPVDRSATLDANSPAEDETPGQDEDIEMTGVSRHGPRPLPDKHAQKRKLRDQLLQELQDLQADISLAESENERLHYLHENGNDKGIVRPSRSKIEELLKRSGYGDDEQEMEEQAKKPLNSFHALSSFLPFSAPLTNQPLPAPTSDEDPIPSHRPLEQEDPLPYLQLFTPLHFSSVITIVPTSADPDTSLISTSTSSSTEVLKDIIQSHTITASSSASAPIFKSVVSILVNTTTFSITSINIDSLSPIAQPELRNFLSKITDANNILSGNIAILFWSMGRWYETAKKRAIFWVRVQSEFGEKSSFPTKIRTPQGQKKRGGKRKGAIHNEDEDENQLEANEDETTFRKLTRKEYLANMGRQSMILEIPVSSTTERTIHLRVEWKIGFDWTGETENLISVGVVGGWPGSWRKHDTRKSLDKLPTTFERIMRERGPLNAVKGVMALLGGSES